MCTSETYMTEHPLWTPDPSAATSSALWRFMEPLGLRSYAEVLAFSVERPEDFWLSLWDFCSVKAETRGARVLVDGHLMPGARFFPDARLNYAENLLQRSDEADALIFRGEDRVRRRMSWAELNREVTGPRPGGPGRVGGRPGWRRWPAGRAGARAAVPVSIT